jgi:hypothetical protein
MIKYIEKEVTTTEKIVSMVACDCCGKETHITDEYQFVCSNITNFSILFGYGSKFDMDTWDFEICDDCIEKWVSTFKHPVKTNDYLE